MDSGLEVQTAISMGIWLNRAITVPMSVGIPFLRPGDVTRDLGYYLGLTNLVWADWDRKLASLYPFGHRIKRQIGLSCSAPLRTQRSDLRLLSSTQLKKSFES